MSEENYKSLSGQLTELRKDLEAKFAHWEEKMAAKGMLHCGGDNPALAETIGRSGRLPSASLSSGFNLSPPIPLEIF